MKQDQEAQLIARVAGNIFGNFYQEYTKDARVEEGERVSRQAAQESVKVATEIVRLAKIAAEQNYNNTIVR